MNWLKQPKLKGGKDERAHKNLLAALPCAACVRIMAECAEGINPGAVELHHLRSGGWGKGSYLTLIPLCIEHHRGQTGVHGMGTKAFERHYGFSQQDLLDDTMRALKEQS